MKRIFSLVCIILCSISVWANSANQNYKVIHDFSNEWLVYDSDVKVYIPYLPKVTENLGAYTLQIDLYKYPSAYLVIETGKLQANIFINHELDRISKSNSKYVYSVEALKKQNPKGNIYFSVFTSDSPKNIKAYIGYPMKNALSSSNKSKDILQLLPKTESKYTSAITIAFMLSLVLMTFISNNYLRVYSKYYSIQDIISTRVKDEMFLIGKPFDRPGVFFLILTSMFVSIAILVLTNYSVLRLGDSIFFQEGNTLGIYLLNFFKVSVISFIVLICKYFFIVFISNIFNLYSLVDIHFFKEMQVNLFVISILIVGLLIMHSLYIPLPQTLDKYLFILLVMFFILRGWAIYFTINRDRNTKFIYLFSYLCVAEALPVVVGLKLIF